MLHKVNEIAIQGTPWQGLGEVTSMLHIDVKDGNPESQLWMLSGTVEGTVYS